MNADHSDVLCVTTGRRGRRLALAAPPVRAAAGPGGAVVLTVPAPRRLSLGPRPDPLDVLERGDDLGHGGPAPRVVREAPQRELGRRLGRALALKARVDQARQPPPISQQRLGPVHQVELVRGAARVHRAQARQHLQQHHAEAVHVALHVQVP
jgi:hypothetical protein